MTFKPNGARKEWASNAVKLPNVTLYAQTHNESHISTKAHARFSHASVPVLKNGSVSGSFGPSSAASAEFIIAIIADYAFPRTMMITNGVHTHESLSSKCGDRRSAWPSPFANARSSGIMTMMPEVPILYRARRRALLFRAHPPPRDHYWGTPIQTGKKRFFW